MEPFWQLFGLLYLAIFILLAVWAYTHKKHVYDDPERAVVAYVLIAAFPAFASAAIIMLFYNISPWWLFAAIPIAVAAAYGICRGFDKLNGM